jgi:hypothetical protein
MTCRRTCRLGRAGPVEFAQGGRGLLAPRVQRPDALRGGRRHPCCADQARRKAPNRCPASPSRPEIGRTDGAGFAGGIDHQLHRRRDLFQAERQRPRIVPPAVPLSDGIASPYDRTPPSHFRPWQSIGLDGRLPPDTCCARQALVSWLVACGPRVYTHSGSVT